MFIEPIMQVFVTWVAIKQFSESSAKRESQIIIR